MEEKMQDRLKELYLKKLAISLSEDESFEMLKLLNQKEAATSLSQFLYEKWNDLDAIQNLRGISDKKIDELFLQIHAEEKIETPGRQVHRLHFLKTAWFRYAAAILIIICGVGGYFLINNRKTERSLAKNNGSLQTDIPPGGEKAILTLADGSKIVLDNAANGNLAQQGSVDIVKLANGQIAYNVKGLTDKNILWNTMSTPAGGQYQITLPDGTKVWLNAASSITYPAVFVGKDRSVKITGEAYFEVAKNKEKPFIVDINGKASIEVLGTSFNINSYANESSIKTTLLEGSVKLVKANQSAVFLKPGQQAVQSRNEKMFVQSADLEQVIAWKNGLFSFNDADLPSVMRQLERWYDIKVKYEDPVSDISLKGEMYRNANLSDVLEFLKTMGISTRMEGKTLVVFKK